MTTMTRSRAVITAVAAVLAVVLVLALTGCTVTVTAKVHDWSGYYLCDGPQPRPCLSGHVWRVSQQEYGQVQVGQSYPFG